MQGVAHGVQSCVVQVLWTRNEGNYPKQLELQALSYKNSSKTSTILSGYCNIGLSPFPAIVRKCQKLKVKAIAQQTIGACDDACGHLSLGRGGTTQYIQICIPWKFKTKQRMVFRMIHVKDSLLPRGKVWSLDFLGVHYYIYVSMYNQVLVYSMIAIMF